MNPEIEKEPRDIVPRGNIACQRPGYRCSNVAGHAILSICGICDTKHQHVKCLTCGYEWNEYL